MRVLVVEPNREERDLAVRLLAAARHEVQSASDINGACALFDREQPEVVVLAWSLPNAGNFLKRIRAMEMSDHVYVVATSAGGPPDVVAAITAGADDFVKKPLLKDEFLLRVGGIDRIRRWAARVLGQKAAHDWSESTNLNELRAWREADRALLRDLEAVIGTSLTVSPSPSPLQDIALGAAMPLTLASSGHEVRLTVGIDGDSLRTIAGLVMGTEDAPPEALTDILREFANTAGGAFKQAALEEGVTLTTGLPANLGPGTPPPSQASAQQGFVLSGSDVPMKIGFHIEIRSNRLLRTTVAQLKEGMVLARDLLSEAGALLVPSGTRLTKSQIDRVARMLSDRIAVEVAEAA